MDWPGSHDDSSVSDTPMCLCQLCSIEVEVPLTVVQVYPSYCVWPHSLVTIALNSALHNDNNVTVPGPFKRFYSMSRYKFFLWAFGAMFIYFWFPNYLFEALTFFSWMTWIAPNNHDLEILTGFRNGLGVGPTSGL